MVIQSRAEASPCVPRIPNMGHSALCKAAAPVQVGWEFLGMGTSQGILLHTHRAMGNVKTVLKIVTVFL